MTPMRSDEVRAIAQGMSDAVSPVINDLRARMELVEQREGWTILPAIDPTVEYKTPVLAYHRNGLFQWDVKAAKWNCLLRSIWEVRSTQVGGVPRVEIEMSDGQTFCTLIKTTPKKAVTKPVKLVKQTRPVFLTPNKSPTPASVVKRTKPVKLVK